MNNKDYLCYLIYMFAEYMFSDATLTTGRVDIFNCHDEITLSINVLSDNLDSIVVTRKDVRGSEESAIVMNVFINFIRMIYVKHDHPFDVIRRLVSVSE